MRSLVVGRKSAPLMTDRGTTSICMDYGVYVHSTVLHIPQFTPRAYVRPQTLYVGVNAIKHMKWTTPSPRPDLQT
jgi:hypothetical protein